MKSFVKLLILNLFFLSAISAQELIYPNYDIGNPSFQEIWVDPVNGSDGSSGSNRNSALRTLNAAWQKIPQNQTLTNAYKILLLPGSYLEEDIPNYFEERHGDYLNPVVIQAASGPGTAILRGDINAFDLRYVYFIDLNIFPSPEGDTFHCEQCDHILLRSLTLNGGNRSAQETLKINQSKYIYLENSDISGASDNNIDFVSVQYGHIVRNKIHSADDWCIYLKGGSAQILVESNEIYNCGTGGFTAGQGTGLEFMTSPWLHYEAYDIKFLNNLVHNTNGAGFGVNGGYNILLAYNTLYKTGRNSHAIEVVYGYRSCDGNVSSCSSFISEGAWGTNVTGIEGEPIPNKNIYIFNNLVFNPAGFESQSSQFAIYGPRNPNSGTNLPGTVVTDSNLRIKSNIIWNGDNPISLGIEDTDQGCQVSNSTCNVNQLNNENYFQSHKPIFVDPDTADFRISPTSPTENITPVDIPDFPDGDRPTSPISPTGNLSNQVARDFTGYLRSGNNSVGAFKKPIRGLTEADGYLLWNSFLGMINIVELTNKGSDSLAATLTVYNTLGEAISQQIVTISGHGQQDIILNSLNGFQNNSYGLVTIDRSSENLGARITIYRPTKNSSDFDFAYSSPLNDPVSGTTHITFNTMQPSGNLSDLTLPVANWLAITNPDPAASHAFNIQRFDEIGNLITTKRVIVPPFGRVDIEGGHETPGNSRIGLNSIIPDDINSPYFANIIRYGTDQGIERDFQFAYPIVAATGGSQTQLVPISNGAGAQNWVEIANVSESSVSISIEVLSSEGIRQGDPFNTDIQAKSQYHFNASQRLGAGASGNLKITSNAAASVISHSLYYFFSPTRSVSAMYGIKAISPSSGQITGSYNLFLGMGNFLKIINTSSNDKTGILRIYSGSTLIKERTLTVKGLGLVELGLHESNNFNTSSDTYGQIEVIGEDLSAYLLRIRPKGSGINFIFPTTLK